MSQYNLIASTSLYSGIETPITNADQLPTSAPPVGFLIVIGNSNITDPITSKTLTANSVYFWFNSGYQIL